MHARIYNTHLQFSMMKGAHGNQRRASVFQTQITLLKKKLQGLPTTAECGLNIVKFEIAQRRPMTLMAITTTPGKLGSIPNRRKSHDLALPFI